jgi:hypothetical protein
VFTDHLLQIAFKIRIARRLSASEEERAKAEKRTGADIIVPSLLPEECPAGALDREWTSYYARAGMQSSALRWNQDTP